MRRLLPVFAACLLLLLVASLVSAGSAGSSMRTMLYVPQPPQFDTVPCGSHGVLLAHVAYWSAPGDAHWTAAFVASGGPGRIDFQTDTESRASVELPPDSSEQWYTLTFTDTTRGAVGDKQLLFGVHPPACTSAPAAANSITVRDLNIWVSP